MIELTVEFHHDTKTVEITAQGMIPGQKIALHLIDRTQLEVIQSFVVSRFGDATYIVKTKEKGA